MKISKKTSMIRADSRMACPLCFLCNFMGSFRPCGSKLAYVGKSQDRFTVEGKCLEYRIDAIMRRGYGHVGRNMRGARRAAVLVFDLHVDFGIRQARFDQGSRPIGIAVPDHILHSGLELSNGGAVAAIERPHGRVSGAGAKLRTQEVVDVECVSELKGSDENRNHHKRGDGEFDRRVAAPGDSTVVH